MSDLERILLTSALTILGGVVVLVIGQLLSKFLIEPIHELRKVVGEVRFSLAFHGPTILTPISRTPERSDKACDALMKCSSELLVRSEVIPSYSFVSWVSCRFVPEKRRVADAAKCLRGLTTYLHETEDKANAHLDEIESRIQRIERNLGLPPIVKS